MNFVYAEEIVDLVTNNLEWTMKEKDLLKNIFHILNGIKLNKLACTLWIST